MVYVLGCRRPAPLYDGVTTLTHPPVQAEGSEVIQGHYQTDKDASGAQKATQRVHVVILNFRFILISFSSAYVLSLMNQS